MVTQVGSIPDKLFYSIGEISEIAKIKPYILRYWESEFKLLKPQKNSGGQRIYRKKDLGLILYIKRLLYDERYTIEGAKRKIKEDKDKGDQLELELVDENISEVLNKAKKELIDLLAEIED